MRANCFGRNLLDTSRETTVFQTNPRSPYISPIEYKLIRLNEFHGAITGSHVALSAIWRNDYRQTDVCSGFALPALAGLTYIRAPTSLFDRVKGARRSI